LQNFKIMSEEKEPGFFAQIKNQIIAGVGVAITAASTLFLDVIKEKLGIVDEEAAIVEQVEQPAQPNIVINIPEAKKDTVVKVIKEKAKPVVKKTETEKRKDEGFDW